MRTKKALLKNEQSLISEQTTVTSEPRLCVSVGRVLFAGRNLGERKQSQFRSQGTLSKLVLDQRTDRPWELSQFDRPQRAKTTAAFQVCVR